MKLQDLSEFEIQVLRRAARGRGLSAVGSVTTDAQFLTSGVRADLRGETTAALQELVRRGIIRETPKPGNPVYTVIPDVQAILDAVDAGATQAERLPKAEELGVEPRLLQGLLGALKDERYVSLIGCETSQEDDVPDIESGKTFMKVDLVLEVTCPKTGETWIRKLTVGVLEEHDLQYVPCKSCDKYHSFRGVRLLPPKH